jgi:hypothetical protein
MRPAATLATPMEHRRIRTLPPVSVPVSQTPVSQAFAVLEATSGIGVLAAPKRATDTARDALVVASHGGADGLAAGEVMASGCRTTSGLAVSRARRGV